MSGPKSATFDVVENRLLQERALRAAKLRASRLIEQRERFKELVHTGRDHFGPEFSVPTLAALTIDVPASTREELEDFIARAQEDLAEAERRLEEERLRHRTQRMFDAVSTGDDSEASGLASLSSPLPTKSPGALKEREERRELLERLCNQLSDASVDVDRWDSLCREFLEAPSESRASALELELRLVIQLGREETRRRANDRPDTLRLLANLAGLTGPSVEAAVHELEQVLRGSRSLTDELRAEAIAAERAARTEADRTYAMDTAARALRKLGYAVDEGFATVLMADGYAHASAPGWSQYAVRVRMDSQSEKLNFNVVRATSDDRDDRAIEEEWCNHFGRVLEDMRQAGVSVEITRQHPPGTLPVQEVDHADIDALARRVSNGVSRRRREIERDR